MQRNRNRFTVPFLAFLGILALASLPARAAEKAPKPEPAKSPRAAAPSSRPAVGAVVNINTATVDEFRSLPKVGPAIAAEIVRYREQHGRFQKVEDLLNVKGIGEKTFLVFKDRVTVGEPAAKD